MIDKENFKILASFDPADVAQRTGCEYDPDTGEYRLEVMANPFSVHAAAGRIRFEGPGKNPFSEYVDLFLLYYLLKSKPIGPSGEWISEKDIPGGAAFFRGPHVIPTRMITRRYKDDISTFRASGKALGGLPLDLGDAAFEFRIRPNVPVAVLYWQGDEDFPSEAGLLFDRTIGLHLPLDIIWALAVGICQYMGQPD